MKFAKIFGTLGFVFFLSACQDKGPVANADSSKQLFVKALTVCNPLSQPPSDWLPDRAGLQGKLYYLTDNMPRFTTVEDYTRAIDTGTTVFLNDVNVPTRMFDRGFPTADGSLLMANGKILVEWFELYLETQIQLTGADADGSYQFAMIADDGATMELMGVNGFKRHVDNDGTHSSRLACATSPVLMDHAVRLPARIKYYQGPRTEIALMLLWRTVPSASSVPAEPLCGATGQDKFFNYFNNPSTPNQAYLDLLSRGWKPLQPGNFVLPGQNRVNPCVTGSNWK